MIGVDGWGGTFSSFLRLAGIFFTSTASAGFFLRVAKEGIFFFFNGCLIRTGNYRIYEFDWLKSRLKSGVDFPI